MPGIPAEPSSQVVADGVRLINIYATSRWISGVPRSLPPGEQLQLGHLSGHYARLAAQLPQVIHSRDIDHLAFTRWHRAELLTGARLWLFAVSSGQVVAVITMHARCALAETVALVEDCFSLDVTIGGKSLGAVVDEVLGESADTEIFPERHQIACSPTLPALTCEDVVRQVIYRSDGPREYSGIAYPEELNRGADTVSAVSAYMSVLGGQEEYVENGAFLSAVQAVASAARLREIRATAYSNLEAFRNENHQGQGAHTQRKTLEDLSNQLGNLELDLSYSVEAPADLGLVVPSLRLVGYHDALYESMRLVVKAEAVERMLRRLERAVAVALTTVESLERRADDERRLRWTVAIGTVSTVAVPIGLVLAFFGVNAREVNVQRSMFDGHYVVVYVLTIVLFLVGALVSGYLSLKQRRHMRKDG